MPPAFPTDIDVTLNLDRALVAKASALGPLERVVDLALRSAVDPAERGRRLRWAEDNALLIEAAANGVEEMAAR